MAFDLSVRRARCAGRRAIRKTPVAPGRAVRQGVRPTSLRAVAQGLTASMESDVVSKTGRAERRVAARYVAKPLPTVYVMIATHQFALAGSP